MQATVFLYAPVDGDPNSVFVGAGTILTPDGYILTNYGLLFDQNGQPHNQAKEIAVGLNSPQDPTATPNMAYWAQFVKSDQAQQFAELRISRPFQAGASLPNDLGLVTMPLGDSDALRAGDKIEVLGYGSGDSPVPVAATAGTILAQQGRGDSLYYTIDAAVNDGDLGGPVVNVQGQMIGMAEKVTNPSPGTGGTVEPIDLAFPLIQSANVESAPGGTVLGGGLPGGASGGPTQAQAPGCAPTGPLRRRQRRWSHHDPRHAFPGRRLVGLPNPRRRDGHPAGPGPRRQAPDRSRRPQAPARWLASPTWSLAISST